MGLLLPPANYSASKRKLNDRPFDQEVKQEARKQLEDYEKSFRFGLVLGISACILSVTPLFLDGSYSLHSQWFSFNGLFFAAVALGVFFIVYVSIIRTGLPKWPMAFTFISNEDEPGPQAAPTHLWRIRRKSSLFNTVYWPVIVVVYFPLVIFQQEAGPYSWVIFILGGVFQDFFLPHQKNKR